MATSQKYWAERARLREEQAHNAALDLEKRLEGQYRKAATAIRKEISDFYARYAKEQGISYEEATRLLTRDEMREWKMSLEDYVAEIEKQTDPKIRARLQADLDARAYRSRIDRLEALKGQINLIADDLYIQANAGVTETLRVTYEESYYRRWYDLQQRVGYMFPVAGVDTKMVEAVLSFPWSGAVFSDRLWKNKEALVSNLSETLTQGIIRGTSPAVMSKDLADKLGVNFRQASLLVRTETAHIHNEADARVEHEAGIEKYEYVATLDERTCGICGPMDGKIYDVDEREEGINAPLMHPGCRCTTMEHDPEEYLDWEAIGEPMPKRMTWSEWKEEQEKAQEEAKKAAAEQAATGLPGDKATGSLQDDGETKTFAAFGYRFSDGTSASSDEFVREAMIYVDRNGTEFAYPVAYDRNAQTIEPQRMMALFDTLPPSLKQQVLTVEAVDYANPQDAYWAEVYGTKGMQSLASGLDGRITIWANGGAGQPPSDETIKRIIAHEAAHTLDQKLGAAIGREQVSLSEVWECIVAADEIVSGKKAPTRYGLVHPQEDFADSVAEYLRDPDDFAKRYPNRAKYLKGALH